MQWNALLMPVIFTAIFTVVCHCASAGASCSERSQQPVLNSILTSYYTLKDALVKDDSKAAAAAGGELLKSINSIDMSVIPTKDHQAFMSLKDKLAYDSRHISESSDIHHQREHFTSLSANMASLAKQAHLSQQPVYEEYCPMKKAYWLSSDTAIKNPYFGSSMLTCGKVAATLKP
jgi:hypothetical protein